MYKVLYIEDNPDNTHLVAAILRRMPKFSFFDAADAETGLNLIQQHQPNIVLMDIDLPNMNGFQAFEEIKNRFAFADQMIVIAISANVMPADIKQGLDAGFFEYLAKPIDIVDFQKTRSKALLNVETAQS